MSGQPGRHSIVYEPHVDSNQTTAPPPPPTRHALYAGPLRRDNVGRPLALTTSIAAAQTGPQYAAPHSAVAYQSPFTPQQPMPVSAAPGTTSRGVSPMAPRSTGRFNVPYDPRDWASGDVGANQARRAREHQGTEEGLTSPPPPYSPQNASRLQQNATASNAPVALETSHAVYSTRVNVSPASPNMAVSPIKTDRRPQSYHPGVNNSHNRASMFLGGAVPPPPPVGGGSRSTSRTGVATAGFSSTNPFIPRAISPDETQHAPTSRRAVSASAGALRQPESGPSSRSSSIQRSWHPGLPLPGPPPGPPPPSARSQSMNSSERSSSRNRTHASSVRLPLRGTELGPIPPTPANWTDDPPSSNIEHDIIRTDTNIHDHISPTALATLNPGPAASTPPTAPATLTRSSAVRDSSIQGLRERRAQNKNSRLMSSDDSGNLLVDTRRRSGTIMQSGPVSARTTNETNSAGFVSYLQSGNVTPLAEVLDGHNTMVESPLGSSTPPLSPPAQVHGIRSAGLPPKSLPTPPLSQKAPHSAHSMIPSSQEYLSPGIVDDTNAFASESLQRHSAFLKLETAAQSDTERLQIFADYIIAESEIRQQKYVTAMNDGEFDVQAVKNKLFKPATQRASILKTNETISSVLHQDLDVVIPQGQNSTAWKDFRPALSPIASMEYDEMSSRGRAPSRWWESQTGSQSGDGKATKIHRSKRESKYMGLSKEFLMAHSPNEDNLTYLRHSEPGPSDSDAFPAEKSDPQTFGYFEDDVSRPLSAVLSKTSDTPSFLDISRFITLPPPYPRHYPAVNNNHPDLAIYRTTVRTLSDLSEVRSRKARQKTSSDALQSNHKRKISDSRRSFRTNVQAQIEDGSISFAEAAEAEEAYKATEFDLEKACLQAEFDTLQDVVVNPLHNLLHERITQLDTSLKQLHDDLCRDARRQDPDGPQEEGDETPELLEKLTQLKWLFDTREQIHKECFDLLSERNDKFGAIVLLPYRFNNSTEKIRDTETFFKKDAQSRFATYCDESSRRHEDFFRTIDEHVQRGVELQSSAFWDIAPGLLDVLQKIPDDLHQLQGIQIPPKEYVENPSYYKHPEQYLYSLLSHAEKSTYQFIEGQINLHCLLHEVKTGLLAARYRLMQAHEVANDSRHDNNLPAAKSREEASLTAELKQKAGLIEEQWLDALGSQLQNKKERVISLLQEESAWDEIAQD